MDWNGCVCTIQGYLKNNPLIVLGSGASVPYGLPSMKALSDSIRASQTVMSDPAYSQFCSLLDSSGLESAVDSVKLAPTTLDAIRQITWHVINSNDLKYFDDNPITPPPALMNLLKKVIAPTPNKAVVVTTNYDRLTEYSADGIGATTVTGFEGSIVRKLEPCNPGIITRRIRARERVVDIWKVHGSLDWFVDASGSIISLPLSRNVPQGFQPLIVPPGKGKYNITHKEPYRTIISAADNAFLQASAYFCVGYGFNDEHIQPKLLTQISNGKPIVILARTMTDACRQHIVDAHTNKYLIFERADETHTKVYGNGWSEIYDGQYWLLDEFLKVW